MKVLEKWSEDSLSGTEYPILTATELVNQGGKVMVIQSDAAGVDGFGYFHGP